jgi:hypothetical protein
MVDVVKTLDLDQLSPKQALCFQAVLRAAEKSKFLGGDETEVIPKKPRCVVILYGPHDMPVGFHTPVQRKLYGKEYWRAGTLFLLPQYEGRGIMKSVLKTFFANHTPCLSWIEDANTKSINLFTSLGFVRGRPKPSWNNEPGHWYLKEKLSLGLESQPVYLQW